MNRIRSFALALADLAFDFANPVTPFEVYDANGERGTFRYVGRANARRVAAEVGGSFAAVPSKFGRSPSATRDVLAIVGTAAFVLALALAARYSF